MIEKRDIEKYAEEHLKGTDRFIVDIHMKPGNVVNLYIDSDTSVTINDCVNLSRYIESKYDRDIEDFELNVSSSGLNQPLKLPRQYKKHINKKISLVVKNGDKIKGILRDFNDKQIRILIEKTKKNKEEKLLTFDLSEIKEAKAVISFN